MKTALNSSFRVVTADSKSRWPCATWSVLFPRIQCKWYVHCGLRGEETPDFSSCVCFSFQWAWNSRLVLWHDGYRNEMEEGDARMGRVGRCSVPRYSCLWWVHLKCDWLARSPLSVHPVSNQMNQIPPVVFHLQVPTQSPCLGSLVARFPLFAMESSKQFLSGEWYCQTSSKDWQSQSRWVRFTSLVCAKQVACW